MENLLLSAKVVMPLIVYMLAGGFVRKLKYMTQENFKSLNTMVFRLFIPLTLFFNIYKTDLKSVFVPDAYLVIGAGIVITFVLTWIITDRFISDIPDGSSMIQGIFRTNYVLFGSYISYSLCDIKGQTLFAALSALVVPLFNMLAVILFEVRTRKKINFIKLIINIFKNPLVDAGILGIILNLISFHIPEIIEFPLIKMGDIATPLALVTLGGLLSFDSILNHKKYLIIATFSRLILIPSLCLIIMILMGYRGDILVAALAVFGAPTAVASGPMAQAMGGNGSLAGEIVASTSVCCVITIFLFVYILTSFSFV